MLVLSRKKDEVIVIGEQGEITITVTDISGGKVKLGISAPKHINVDRAEIYREKKRRAEEEAQNG